MKSPFESKREFVVPWIIVMLLGSLLFLVGCDSYSEGDQKAGEAFEKMTTVEKGMYDVVEAEWGESRLEGIRGAIWNREVKPLEETVPFIDIANIIKANNDMTLKVKKDWRTDTKNAAINARWDRLDNVWYIKIINALGLKANQIKRQELFEELEDTPPQPETIVNNEVVIQPELTDDEYWDREERLQDSGHYIEVDDYDDLYYELRGCQPAIDEFSRIIDLRLITVADRELLIKLAITCKAKQIEEKLNDN